MTRNAHLFPLLLSYLYTRTSHTCTRGSAVQRHECSMNALAINARAGKSLGEAHRCFPALVRLLPPLCASAAAARARRGSQDEHTLARRRCRSGEEASERRQRRYVDVFFVHDRLPINSRRGRPPRPPPFPNYVEGESAPEPRATSATETPLPHVCLACTSAGGSSLLLRVDDKREKGGGRILARCSDASAGPPFLASLFPSFLSPPFCPRPFSPHARPRVRTQCRVLCAWRCWRWRRRPLPQISPRPSAVCHKVRLFMPPDAVFLRSSAGRVFVAPGSGQGVVRDPVHA